MTAALALAATTIGLLSSVPPASPAEDAPCDPERRTIPAAALAADTKRCVMAGRPITDGAVAAVLPPRGEGVHVETLTAGGAQELVVAHLPDGGISLGHVGEEPEVTSNAEARAAETFECQNPSYQSTGRRVEEELPYRINRGTVPRELSPDAAVTAIRQAGSNVANTRNDCGLGDRVPARIPYGGKTSLFPDLKRDGSCAPNDGRSVVAFGRLPSRLAVTCVYFRIKPGPDRVVSSDVKLDKVNFRWTTGPGSRSCDKQWDLQGVMTHEWGHAFGLGHVPEAGNPNMTMSPVINGPCQLSERTLGRGDVLGLDNKYP